MKIIERLIKVLLVMILGMCIIPAYILGGDKYTYKVFNLMDKIEK